MTVKEVKTLVPLAEVYELRPESRYLFLIPVGENVDDLLPMLKEGMEGAVVQYHDTPPTIYEIGEKNENPS